MIKALLETNGDVLIIELPRDYTQVIRDLQTLVKKMRINTCLHILRSIETYGI